MSMKISNAGINLIKSFEGLRLSSYKPVSTEKMWTIGYGHYGVQNGLRITQAQADAYLLADLKKFEGYVNDKKYVPVIDFLNQNQFDALVSFAFNCGQGNLQTLCKGRTVKEIGESLEKYNKAGGVVLNGLVKRRKAEKDLFFKIIPIENPIKKEDADQIIKLLQKGYSENSGNKTVQNKIHELANEIRKLSGQNL